MTSFRSFVSRSAFANLNPVAGDPLAKLRAWEPLSLPATTSLDGQQIDASRVARIIVRSDDCRPLAAVSPSYTIVPHRETLALFDALAERGVITDLRCGELSEGRKVFVQCRPKQGGIAEVAGHEIRQRLTLLDSHDGTSAQKLVDTSINVVCLNTYRFAARQGFAMLVSRHTRNARERWERAAEGILAATKGWDKEIERLRVWAETPVTAGDLRVTLDKFFPVKGDAEQANRDKRERIASLYETAPGAKPGTVYGIWQAFTYWTSHEAGRSSGRDLSLLSGTSARLQQKLHEMWS
jgi:phage/plasmid-like protein (TIGR03299 family)